MGADVDTDGDGIPNVEWPEEPAEEFEDVAQYGEAWETNVKRIVDEWAAVSHNKATQVANLQDLVNSQFLRFVEDQHTLLMRTADANALVQNRAANNAATLDLLIASGEVDTTAQGIAGLKLSDAFQDVAQQAVKAAVAAVPGTSAPSQGTTGVAQGAMQTGAGVSVADLVTQVSKLAGMVDLIAVKVLGEEVTKVK